VAVPYHIMAMGGEFTVDAPGQTELTVHISAGTPSGALIPFRGKGMPSVTGRGRGTLYVRTSVDVPKKLSKEQKRFLEQLGKTMPVDKIEAQTFRESGDKPFFEKGKDLFG
jgi:molecular chaperone DnaJ